MKTVIGVLSFLFLVCLPAAAQTQAPIRVKAGGAAYTDSKAQVWSADFGFNGGLVSKTTGTVTGTPDPALFQGGRMPDTTPLIYTFPVANGSYHVNLYFAELNPGDDVVGGRVFTVKLQGAVVFQNLDIFAAVGANAALIKGADIAVTTGSVQIELDNVANHDRGKVAAIEIIPSSSAPSPQLQLNFVYPDGTPVVGTLNYSISTSLVTVQGNQPLSNGQATCLLFANSQLMGLVGQLTVNLSLTDNASHTLWQLVMTMNTTTVNIAAVQTSSLNVIVQKM